MDYVKVDRDGEVAVLIIRTARVSREFGEIGSVIMGRLESSVANVSAVRPGDERHRLRAIEERRA
jgi:hypothetical protein